MVIVFLFLRQFAKSLIVEDLEPVLDEADFSKFSYLAFLSQSGRCWLVKPECCCFPKLYNGT